MSSAILAPIERWYMKATNKKTEQDMMAEYLEMMERGEGKEYVYTA